MSAYEKLRAGLREVLAVDVNHAVWETQGGREVDVVKEVGDSVDYFVDQFLPDSHVHVLDDTDPVDAALMKARPMMTDNYGSAEVTVTIRMTPGAATTVDVETSHTLKGN